MTYQPHQSEDTTLKTPMAADLKPCPFCGSEPWGIFGPHPELGKWWVECHGPDDNTCCGDWFCTVDSDDRETARAEVAEAWNRRVPPGVMGAPAHSKSEYKRRVAQGDANVQPPNGVGDME